MADKQNVVFENVRIGFRNFAGKEGKYNAKGKRNFCIFLDDEVATAMAEDGWNIRWLKPRDEEDEPQAYLQVAVAFGARPPRIVLVKSQGKNTIGEDLVDLLDWADIKNVDLIIRAYEWDINGKTGTKAYLKSLYVTLEEDELEQKYIDVPDSAASSVIGVPWEEDE